MNGSGWRLGRKGPVWAKAWRPPRRPQSRGLHRSSHCACVSSLLQVVGTGLGGPCFCCQPPRGLGRHHGAQPPRSPSCSPTCALSPGKRLGWVATPSFQPLSLEPRIRQPVDRHHILPANRLSQSQSPDGGDKAGHA